MIRRKLLSLLLANISIGAMLTMPLQAQADEQSVDNDWHLTGKLYLWGAGFSGSTQSGSDFDVSFGDLADNLDFALMGGLEARKARWSFIWDIIYMDIAAKKSGSLTDLGLISVNADVNLEGWVSNLLAGYSLTNTDAASAEVIFGARYLDLDAKLNISITEPVQTPGLDFTGGVDVWDAVVGLRGGINLSKSFYIPYYADIGTGQSDLTWQALLGIGYKPRWGEITLAYRHVDWDFESGSTISDIDFSGPGLLFKYNFF
jgi:hypothetical protein